MSHPTLSGKTKALAFSIVMEFADDGDLFGKCADLRKRQQLMDESDIWKIFIQLVKGL